MPGTKASTGGPSTDTNGVFTRIRDQESNVIGVIGGD
jgi:hypothetical protein